MIQQNSIYISKNYLMGLKSKAVNFRTFVDRPIRNNFVGRFSSKVKGQGLIFEEMDNYRLGDDIRNMNWRLSQKLSRPIVKRFTEDKERPVYLVVDQSSTMFFGSTYKLKSVVACELATISYWSVVGNQDPVGAFLISNDGHTFIKATKSTNKSMAILSELEAANRKLDLNCLSNKVVFVEEALKRLRHEVSQNSLIIFISDFLEFNEEAFSQLKMLASKHELVIGHIVDQNEERLPAVSNFVISNSKREISINSRDQKLRNKYKENWDGHVNRLYEICRKLSFPIFTINTHEDIFTQLKQRRFHE
ncbi:PF01882 family protein [Bacteriovorax sp. BAL6_X]|uniref:DUF58 domain-containing protein n=1 Tax=Bacteriovorax sp. BAL6_X TaxID=1201290 RepID=UPI00038692A3|nr:DUF58 domain-containing protein [Bacteriovorax sp. BAL6_X]EPZ50870.1 PF01882 family protein [Bacteriovorax sp. BAL6_X]